MSDGPVEEPRPRGPHDESYDPTYEDAGDLDEAQRDLLAGMLGEPDRLGLGDLDGGAERDPDLDDDDLDDDLDGDGEGGAVERGRDGDGEDDGSGVQGSEEVREFATVQEQLLARTPEHDLTPSLERIALLVDLLGNPQQAYPVIHLTGTNGKTTTTRLVESLLREFGLRTGRFTSPHLHSVTERISIDGQPIAIRDFVRTWHDVLPLVELVDSRSDVPMSYFEVLVGLGYAAFADTPVDVAVVEVGMGGTWDATNVADGRVAVITPIDIDHTRFLGSTVTEIATEKSGIIKPGATAVVAQQPPEALEVLSARAREVGATLLLEGVDFGVVEREVAVWGQRLRLQGIGGVYDDVFLPLHGEHQAHNAAVALVAVEAFLGGGAGRLDPDVVRAAYAAATSPGRLEVVRRSPTVIVDAAHNPAGARATAAALQTEFDFTRLVGVIAAFADKDVEGILTAFEPVLAEVVVTAASSPRAMPVDELADIAEGIFGVDRVTAVPKLGAAIETAIELADASGEASGAGVVVTGSIVTVAQARSLLGKD
ncbi:MAG: bifunctional folylpolyglutamate synthase/dihydrofolate synthase [Actinomycetales bacterium]